MQLSAELFEWIVSTIGPVAPEGGAGRREQRNAQRIPLRGRVEAFVLRDGSGGGGDDEEEVDGPFDVRVIDVSTGGVRCELTQAVSRGTRVVLRLARAGDEPVMLLSEVAHAKPCQQRGGWQTGLKFVRAVDAGHADQASARPLACAF
jgi:hypothetical protein